ncbi:hypothetical protein IQ238_13915 [Pleurocapsales cyanobacterium LEGE 06147]|nr:hypothetical protein [Pleurocapsales cyanobacterium LEGE 06147]
MKNKIFPWGVTLSLGFALALIFGLDRATLAQSQTPENDGYQSNEQDALFGNSSSGLNPLELMHRVNMMNRRGMDEFNNDSQINIQNSAEEFKRLQQERFRQQEQSSSSESKTENK